MIILKYVVVLEEIMRGSVGRNHEGTGSNSHSSWRSYLDL